MPIGVGREAGRFNAQCGRESMPRVPLHIAYMVELCAHERQNWFTRASSWSGFATRITSLAKLRIPTGAHGRFPNSGGGVGTGAGLGASATVAGTSFAREYLRQRR